MNYMEIKIEGFGLVQIDRDAQEAPLFPVGLKLEEEVDNFTKHESTATFWFDYLPSICAEHNIDEDQLKYILADIGLTELWSVYGLDD